MDLYEFKKEYICSELGINKEFGKIFSFIDFGNVNKWFEKDRQNYDHKPLLGNQQLAIDIEKIKEFADIFSDDVRFYYGYNKQDNKSLGFIRKSRYVFGKRRVFTKPIQKIKHYLTKDELNSNNQNIYNDKDGIYIYVPKCNFDVEISVDAMRFVDKYETICLFSGDADFVYLLSFLKSKKKKIILIKGGYITYQLRKMPDIIINAQDIKKHITFIKQKPDF